MSPNRAEEYIKAFHLPECEEAVLIFLDVKQKSCVETGRKIGMTEDTVKRYRKKAYAHIADEISNKK